MSINDEWPEYWTALDIELRLKKLEERVKRADARGNPLSQKAVAEEIHRVIEVTLSLQGALSLHRQLWASRPGETGA